MIRVKIKSWTASFRYPTFQSGYQPTLPVPPLSTIQGILSAAKGEVVSFTEIPYTGYVFKSEGQGVDLERIYALGKPETDVIRREILFDNTLYLYLPDEWAKYFRKPKFQLLLGRSSDIATVENITEIELEEKPNVPVGGTIVPVTSGLSGLVHALPVEFDYSTIPRRAKIVRPFIVLPFPRNPAQRKRQTYKGKLPYDPEMEIGVWLYESLYGQVQP
ncbi:MULTISPECIES: type I-B CRISPR-associated protein Cas5b [Archaeoglobus]|uniref:CRISPR-associated protein Cas5 family n=1 Tax=Archaeoglobus fulgidus TaxID=2234 RepID=A0A101E292_ARCFL|nr:MULTISPECIES: type I-B CRISPR-associated protein Cas5b [Archaeoglobus]KUJ94612.1 MAG: CRISPR-associated protein Cas5 family [Archaeoglobus fulgidus]KUK07484.1 MAG: CRISPR-associated protein Cas5 family [Archaeoglobus fulgidus]MDI3497094.1 CRISPR-associated protein Cas5t [Archaeoglobus sp.]